MVHDNLAMLRSELANYEPLSEALKDAEPVPMPPLFDLISRAAQDEQDTAYEKQGAETHSSDALRPPLWPLPSPVRDEMQEANQALRSASVSSSVLTESVPVPSNITRPVSASTSVPAVYVPIIADELSNAEQETVQSSPSNY